MAGYHQERAGLLILVIIALLPCLAVSSNMLRRGEGNQFPDARPAFGLRKLRGVDDEPPLNPPPCPMHPEPVPSVLVKNLSPKLKSAFAKAESLIRTNISVNSQIPKLQRCPLAWCMARTSSGPNPSGWWTPAGRRGAEPGGTGHAAAIGVGDQGNHRSDADEAARRGQVEPRRSRAEIRPRVGDPNALSQRRRDHVACAGDAEQRHRRRGPVRLFSIWEPLLNAACEISNAEAWKRLSTERQTFAPMYESPHYADSAYAIIGRALEEFATDGRSYEDYVMQEIFAPLGMKNSFYELTSERAAQLPPGMNGNGTEYSFLYKVDFHWARPTGQLYSTVNDIAKLQSFFLQGKGSPVNKLGMRSSTIREMLLPAYVNDDFATAYGFPFETYASSAYGLGETSAYWFAAKGGSVPGYEAFMLLCPKLQLGVVALMNNDQASDAVGYITRQVVPALEATLLDLAQQPLDPGNLTSYEGIYKVSALFGAVTGSGTIRADSYAHMLLVQLNFSIEISAIAKVINATWAPEVGGGDDGGQYFRLHPDVSGIPCLFVEVREVYRCIDLLATHTMTLLQNGINLVYMRFQVDSGGNAESFTLPGVDPFYGWTFYKAT